MTIQYKNAKSCFAISVSVVRHVSDRTKKTFIKCIKTLKVKLEIKEFLTARMIMVASVANSLHAMTFRFGGGLFNFWWLSFSAKLEGTFSFSFKSSSEPALDVEGMADAKKCVKTNSTKRSYRRFEKFYARRSLVNCNCWTNVSEEEFSFNS